MMSLPQMQSQICWARESEGESSLCLHHCEPITLILFNTILSVFLKTHCKLLTVSEQHTLLVWIHLMFWSCVMLAINYLLWALKRQFPMLTSWFSLSLNYCIYSLTFHWFVFVGTMSTWTHHNAVVCTIQLQWILHSLGLLWVQDWGTHQHISRLRGV